MALVGLAAILHALAAGVMLALVGPGWVALCLLPAVGASFVSWLRATGMAVLGRGLAIARWHEDESWTLSEHGGRSCVARLDAGGVCHPKCVALTWRGEDGRAASALVFKGPGENEMLRRLRSRLRCSDAV